MKTDPGTMYELAPRSGARARPGYALIRQEDMCAYLDENGVRTVIASAAPAAKALSQLQVRYTLKEVKELPAAILAILAPAKEVTPAPEPVAPPPVPEITVSPSLDTLPDHPTTTEPQP